MKRWNVLLPLLVLSGGAYADITNCTNVPKSMPRDASLLAPVAAGLATASGTVGSNNSGVLAFAYDSSQSVDQVLLRMRIEKCNDLAKTLPVVPGVNPNDPATYKPQTQWDNTPWRFNMTQNGKRMTADEFSAWMAAKGVRVAKGRAPTPAAEAAAPVPVGSAPVSAVPGASAPAATPAQSSPTLPTVPATTSP